MEYKLPKGTKDIFGEEVRIWQKLEKTIRETCDKYGYGEIRTPIFEQTNLFARGVGEDTDIVQKEMYTFKDKGGRSITLKPEGTAGVVRAYLTNGMYVDPSPKKLYYITPAFRYEKPQAGRQRQFHQFGIEAFGAKGPNIDAEVISLAYQLFKKLGIEDVTLLINNIGCPNCRDTYNKALKEYLISKSDELCETCQSRLDNNPLRVLDCKEDKEIIDDAPKTIEYLDEECEKHFEKLKKILDKLEIPYEVDTTLVRGLDYYTKTVFEFVSNEIGAQGTICGGGRYDGLVEEFGGNKTPGVGFGLGIERLVLSLKENIEEVEKDIYIVSIGEDAYLETNKLVYKLRENNIAADMDHLNRSVGAQMKFADKQNFTYTTVIGGNELEEGKLSLRKMKTGDEKDIKINELVDVMREIKGV